MMPVLRRRLVPLVLSAAAAWVLLAPAGAMAHGGGVRNIVVIYEENHSFDNLFGGWEGVNGLGSADAAHTTQVDQAGVPYACLKQNDVNLAALPATCNDAAHGFTSAFTNNWFTIDTFIPPTATTCPTPQTA